MREINTWKEEIICALEELGGDGSYKDIYNKIIERNTFPDRMLKKAWKSTVRDTIESYSSDSMNYREGRDDIFFSVDGIGNGRWGLRHFTPSENKVDISEDDLGFAEGKKKLKEHIYRERNPEVIKVAKERFKEQHGGRLFCEACSIELSAIYNIDDNFIEGHHEIPISKVEENSITRPEDIVMLCPNCHRMIHRIRPWITRKNLRKLFRNTL